MKILVIGSGGREHALVWTFANRHGSLKSLRRRQRRDRDEPKTRNVAVAADDLDGLSHLRIRGMA